MVDHRWLWHVALCAVWAGFITAALASVVVPALRRAGGYGKTLEPASKVATVPKSWFFHFYLLGAAVNCGVLVSALHDNSLPLVGMLFHAHLCRRLYECMFVHAPMPSSRMPWTVYGGGIAHYVFAPLSLSNRPASAVHMSLGTVPAVTVFIAANVVQFLCHLHLASLRAPPATPRRTLSPSQVANAPPRYRLPTASVWFRRVACPHYTAEVCMYLALAGVDASATPMQQWLLTAWVAANLTVTATKSLAWYRTKFADVPPRWRAIVPFVV